MQRPAFGFVILALFGACTTPASFEEGRPSFGGPATFPSAAPAAEPAPPSSPAGQARLRPSDPLVFSIDAGGAENRFFRSGKVAAHLLLAAGRLPRFIVAFPAGDSGAALWFDDLPQGTHVDLDGPLVSVERPGGMRGVTATLHVGAPSLHVREAVLGGIRAIRERASGHTLPPDFAVKVEGGPAVVLKRTMLDGRRVRVELSAGGAGSLAVDGAGRISAIAAPREGGLTLHATALTDEDALTPIPADALLADGAGMDRQSRDALAFLASDEKLLAGSWRFLTYFGRDTLLSLQMLMPALGALPIEAGLGAVLDRVGESGEVAHEEVTGEWALVEGRSLEYGMVDGDFLLAPTLCRYLLDTPEGRARARSFLDRRAPSGVTYRETVRRNLARIASRAAPFAASHARSDLISLAPTSLVGNWRDSETGLGGGRIPYDVNAALVPAALEAAARLLEGPLIEPDGEAAARMRSYLSSWRDVGSLFRVEVPTEEARSRVSAYAAAEGLTDSKALDAIDGPVSFEALALTADGTPIPVLHSDVAFRWVFDAPSSDELVRQVRRLMAPFPAGLMTPVGIVVANPALSGDAALTARFTPHDYHGTVVWSWQQALMAAGLSRQLARADLPEDAKHALADAERALWSAIRATQEKGMSTAELWSFHVRDGRMELMPFGEGGGDADESNAVQLWSTVFLAVRPSWERK